MHSAACFCQYPVDHFLVVTSAVHMPQVACASSLDELPAPLRRCFTHEIAAPAPNAAQRARLLAGFLRASAEALPAQELDEVAAQTAGSSTAFVVLDSAHSLHLDPYPNPDPAARHCQVHPVDRQGLVRPLLSAGGHASDKRNSTGDGHAGPAT